MRSDGSAADGTGYRAVSLWHDDLAAGGEDTLTPRPPLAGDTDADVCIVGAGYTGLWTAYYLLRADPSLHVVVLEAEIAGFGASGRNGGWCSALFPTTASALARRHGRAAAIGMRRAMNDTVAEVGRVTAAEGIVCDYVAGGSVRLARTDVQLHRARTEVAADGVFGGVDGVLLLDAQEARSRVGARDVLGATYLPHCARIHPARLVRGLARVVERRGALIAERTRALRIEPGLARAAMANPVRDPASWPRVVTDRGVVRARRVVRATEAWTARLPGMRQTVIPVYSLIVATEPLPASFWDGAGLAHRETFADHRHLIVYGQRTADDRLVFGGRGAPYHLGSRIEPGFDREPGVFAALRRGVVELFPAVRGHAFTHAWGGPLAIARDWHAGVGLNAETGIGWAGGYVGDGVGAANLAGRTLADLITDASTALTRLPWVGHRSARWEPEPLRWLEVNAGLRVMRLADVEERLTHRPSLLARTMAPLLGH